MKKIALLFVATVISVMCAHAVPAYRRAQQFTQPDGSVITLTLQGDEFGHWYTTMDGYAMKRGANGMFVPCSTFELAAIQQRRIEGHQRRWQASHNGNAAPARRAGTSKLPKGDQRVLVLLAEFSDYPFVLDNPQETFKNHLNKENNSEGIGYGSARDYFLAQSGGEFRPQFDVWGPYKVSNPMKNYGENDDQGHDKNAAQLVAEVLKLANPDINFKDYDTDNDGVVDFCYVIYAGYGEAHGANENTIWPHQWRLSSGTGAALKLDGVQVDEYACSCELYGYSGNEIDGIGTICHEFGHCLGLPDFYDTGDAGNFGMNAWSIMDYGCYNEGGYTPCGYTAYEKEYLGWLKIETLDEEQTVTLVPTSEGGKAYRIENSANTNEYYIVENIQQTGWNRSAYGHGMLVTHVDYKQAAWISNTVNNYDPQRMTIVPADNTRIKTRSSLAGDPYPGTSGNTELTDYSLPSTETNDGGYFSQPITEITEKDGVITFEFLKGSGEATTALEAKDVNESSFNARWKRRLGTENYTLEVFHITGEIPTDKNQWGIPLLNAQGELISTVKTSQSEEVITNLEANNLYCYRVRCLKDGNLSPFSNLIYVQTVADPGKITPPTLHKPLKDSTDVTFAWTPVEGAEKYILEYSPVETGKQVIPDGRLLVSEDFKNVKTSCGEIGRVLDIYTDTTGWRGSEVHSQAGKIQLGSEEEYGYILTPTLPQTNGMITIEFSVSKYSQKDNRPILFFCLATDADKHHYADVKGVYVSSTDEVNYYTIMGPLDTGSYLAYLTDTETDSEDTPRVTLDNLKVFWGDLTEKYERIGAKRISFEENLQASAQRMSALYGQQLPSRITEEQKRPSRVATSTKQYIETSDTLYLLTGMDEGSYIFRVRAVKGNDYSPFSDVKGFTIGKDFYEENGMFFELTSEEMNTVQLAPFNDGRTYEGDIVVPESIVHEGITFTVTALGDSVFRGCNKLTSVVVPPSISYAGSTIFKGCHQLSYVDWKSSAPIDSTYFVGVGYNTLLYVYGDTEAVTEDAYIVRDGQADSVSLNLNSPFIIPHEFKARHIEYVKDFSQENVIGVASGWETLVLPFDVQRVSHEEKGILTPFGVSGSEHHFWLGAFNGTAFEHTQAIKAHVPYIISFPNSNDYQAESCIKGSITFSADNATVHSTMNVPAVNGTEFNFVPVYEKVFKAANRLMLNTYDHSGSEPAGSTFQSNKMSLRAFGAYMQSKGASKAPHQFPIRFIYSEEEEAPAATTGTAIYSPDGRLVRDADETTVNGTNGLHPGIYISRGKKVIIR